MNTSKPPATYDHTDQAQFRLVVEKADKQNRKIGTDVEIGKQKLVLTSPDGTRFNITVANDGTISATSL